MHAIWDFLMKYVIERLLDNFLRLIGFMPGAVGSSFIVITQGVFRLKRPGLYCWA